MAQGPRDFIDPNKYFPNSLLFMENTFLTFLQALFATFQPSQFADPGTGSYHYDDDPTFSEIAIEGQNTDNLTAVDTRPKIVVARGPVQINKVGLDSGVGQKNLSLLQKRYTSIREGTVGISCYSRSDLEADKLAEFCADSIESLVPQIRMLGFLEVRTAQIGQRAMIKADSRPELFVTPVLVRAKITKNYNVNVVDPVVLRQIVYQLVIRNLGINIPPTV